MRQDQKPKPSDRRFIFGRLDLGEQVFQAIGIKRGMMALFMRRHASSRWGLSGYQGRRRQRASTASVLEWRGGFQHRSVALGAPNFDALINAPKDCRFANWPE
jgi:hypothetical protein